MKVTTDPDLGQAPKHTTEYASQNTHSPIMGYSVNRVSGDLKDSAGRTICAACGRHFWPDNKVQKYCDRECYAASYARTPTVDRFWSKVNKNGPRPQTQPQLGPCWLWTASTTGRVGMHGQFALPRVEGEPQRHVYAHRYSWELANGPIPDGLSILHKCDVGICVRPTHLFLGTQQDNLADARRKGRLDNSKPRLRKREVVHVCQ